MITLRHFDREDAGSVRSFLYPDMTEEAVSDMIAEWNTCVYNGRCFESFAVLSDDRIVGCLSLYELSQNAVSAGAEIFPAERGKGFASEAMPLLLGYASKKGYRLVLDQVRTDNTASIRLHEKLGFETYPYVYRNQRGREILIYIKLL